MLYSYIIFYVTLSRIFLATDVGMVIDEPFRPFRDFRPDNIDLITQYFNSKKKLKLIIVVISNRTDTMYGEYIILYYIFHYEYNIDLILFIVVLGSVKKISEMEVGVLTQCIKAKTLNKSLDRRQSQTVKNILLKINSKLNGVNHTFDKM